MKFYTPCCRVYNIFYAFYTFKLLRNGSKSALSLAFHRSHTNKYMKSHICEQFPPLSVHPLLWLHSFPVYFLLVVVIHSLTTTAMPHCLPLMLIGWMVTIHDDDDNDLQHNVIVSVKGMLNSRNPFLFSSMLYVDNNMVAE